jgi:hypothetical protein
MTLREIEASDPESAHGDEDELWYDVLAAIASDTLVDCSPSEAAVMALTSATVEFPRWRA